MPSSKSPSPSSLSPLSIPMRFPDTGSTMRIRPISIYPNTSASRNLGLFHQLEMYGKHPPSSGPLQAVSDRSSSPLSSLSLSPSPMMGSFHSTPEVERQSALYISHPNSECLRLLLSITPSSETSGKTESRRSSLVLESDEFRPISATSPTGMSSLLCYRPSQ